MDGYRDGDIVTTESLKHGEEEYLLVRCYERYATAVRLQEQKPKENAAKVISRAEMWANIGKMGYLYYNKITGYIKSLTDDDLNAIKKDIADTLEISLPNPGIGTLAPLELDDDTDTLEEIKHTMQDLSDAVYKQLERVRSPEEEDVRLLQRALNRAETERDIYKELYEQERGLWSVSEIGAMQSGGSDER